MSLATVMGCAERDDDGSSGATTDTGATDTGGAATDTGGRVDTGRRDTGQVVPDAPTDVAQDTGQPPEDSGADTADLPPEDAAADQADSAPPEDAAAEVGEDTAPDTAEDVGVDATDDALVDAAPDALDDAAPDALVDAAPDALDVADEEVAEEDLVDAEEDTVEVSEEDVSDTTEDEDVSEVCVGPEVDDLIINEVLPSPPIGGENNKNGDANCDGTRDGVEDELVEIVNVSGGCLDLEGVTISDNDGVRHTFGAGVTLGPLGVAVVFGGGDPVFDGTSTNDSPFCVDLSSCDAVFQVADGLDGILHLGNSGETVTLRNGDGDELDSMTYTNAHAVLQVSQVRDPDLTGDFTAHDEATGAEGAELSPGTRIDGTPFVACD